VPRLVCESLFRDSSLQRPHSSRPHLLVLATIAALSQIVLMTVAIAGNRSAGQATYEAASAPPLMQLSQSELEAATRGDRKFSPVVAEYLAARDAVSKLSLLTPQTSVTVNPDEATRMVRLGLIRRIMEGEGLTVYLFGVSGQVYRSTQVHRSQILKAADTVDPAGVFIVRVEH